MGSLLNLNFTKCYLTFKGGVYFHGLALLRVVLFLQFDTGPFVALKIETLGRRFLYKEKRKQL